MKKRLCILVSALLLIMLAMGYASAAEYYTECPNVGIDILVKFHSTIDDMVQSWFVIGTGDNPITRATLYPTTLTKQPEYDESGELIDYVYTMDMKVSGKKEGNDSLTIIYQEAELARYNFTFSHTWGDWTVIRNATNAREGLKRRICSKCSAKEEAVIPRPSYTITYQMNGGTNHPDNPASVIAETTVILNNPTRKGYSFGGWYTDKEMTKESPAIKVFENMTVYAKWIPHTYKVIFKGNGATAGKMKNQSIDYGVSQKLTANAFKRKGYAFSGWNTKDKGNGKSYADKAKVKNLIDKDGAAVTLYAQWTANSYTVKFNGNGATSGKMKTMKCKYGVSKKLISNQFKREGYRFIGWNTKANGRGGFYTNKTKVKNLTAENGVTVTLYAQWKAIN